MLPHLTLIRAPFSLVFQSCLSEPLPPRKFIGRLCPVFSPFRAISIGTKQDLVMITRNSTHFAKGAGTPARLIRSTKGIAMRTPKVMAAMAAQPTPGLTFPARNDK
jgi:hypothetical protein